MKTKKVEQLIAKFEQGQTSLEEEEALREYFRGGEVPEHLKSYIPLFHFYEQSGSVRLSSETDPFSGIRFNESGESGSGIPNRSLVWLLRIAAGFILLLAGFSAGLIVGLQEKGANRQVAELRREVDKMKNVLMYGTVEGVSASERITAVNEVSRIPEDTETSGREITRILIYTMNNDDNTNVRQAAAEALFRFSHEEEIRQALVSSLARQSDPLMQVTLIDMLVELKEKAAVGEMQKLMMDSGIHTVVRTRLEAGIAELNT